MKELWNDLAILAILNSVKHQNIVEGFGLLLS